MIRTERFIFTRLASNQRLDRAAQDDAGTSIAFLFIDPVTE
jgi:hypothetical protein